MGSNADRFEEFYHGFTDKYPFITVKGIDANSFQTVNRVVAEGGAGKVTVDVMDISDDGAYPLADQGMLQIPDPAYPHLANFDPRTQPSSGLFVAHTINPRPQGIYNTELVPAEEVPRSWEEVASPRWKGKVILNSGAHEFPGRLAYLWREDGKLGWERSFDFWRKIKAQDPLIATGYRRGTEQVASGERAIFWLAPGSLAAKIVMESEGQAPMGVISFPQYFAGFRCTGIIKGAHHPASSWLFIDYLTSPEGQFEYSTVIGGHMPLNKKAEPGGLVQWLVAQGVTIEDSPASAADFTIDSMATVIYNEENAKKSKDFFLELMGIR
jgi:iron(III) transport system substrate-binding protein